MPITHVQFMHKFTVRNTSDISQKQKHAYILLTRYNYATYKSYRNDVQVMNTRYI